MPFLPIRSRGPKPEANPNMGVRNWCEKHWAPYREDYARAKAEEDAGRPVPPSANGILATVLLTHRALDDGRFYAEALKHCPPGVSTPGPEEMNAAIRATAPQCCFLGDEAMAAILEEARRLQPPAPSEAT